MKSLLNMQQLCYIHVHHTCIHTFGVVSKADMLELA